jgi:asparagine synthase (glutamine-hydrolysing)
VSLGVSLSGGLDSSSIACVMSDILGGAPFETFSSCFDDERYDERRFIDPVLKRVNAKSNLVFTKPDNLLKDIEDIIWHQDEPYSTLSILPQWNVMKLAREKGVKVILTGQGGDETLAGYHKYYLYLFADLVHSFKFGEAKSEIKAYREFKKDEGFFGAVSKIILSYMMPKVLREALSGSGKSSLPGYLNKEFIGRNSKKVFSEKRYKSILNNDLYNALKISPLPSLLHIDDRSSMAHSVETRAPFLDYRLVEFLFSLGSEYKIHNGYTKYVLRESLKGVLPEEVRMRRDKMGFVTPLESWLKTDIKHSILDILSSKEFASRPYFNKGEVLKEYEDFVNGNGNVSHYTIWSWVNLELWMRKFIN